MATQIAIGALRYFLLKFTRNSVIAFDFQEALSFEGETGPYVQYAAVRARNILRKLEERGEPLPDFAAELDPRSAGAPAASRRFLADAAGGIEGGFGGRACGALRASRRTWRGTPSNWRRRSAISTRSTPIIHEADREKKVFLLWMTDFFRRQLERTGAILGIQIPEYM